MRNLFYDTKMKSYVMIKPCFCDFCNGEVVSGGINYRYYGRKHKGEFVVCMGCARDLKKPSSGVIIELKTFVLATESGGELVPVLDQRPVLKDGDVSVFEAASELSCVRVIDRTVHAGRVSLEGAKVGLLVEDECPKLIEERILGKDEVRG